MHKRTLLLPLFIVLVYSCNGQPGRNDSGNKQQPKTQLELLDSLVQAGIDPYFVESTDTFSVRGPQCIVRDVLQDNNGNFWLATWQGIIKYDGKVFTNYTLKENLIRFHVLALFEDSKGNLWFSLVRGGVYRYDARLNDKVGQGKSFRLFTTRDGLAHNTTLAFAEDQNGNIWFGTENGLSSFDGKSFTSYTTRDGLMDNYVNALLSDGTGKLWIGTTKGINLYEGNSFKEFLDNDGKSFQSVASLFQDKAGNIWIGSSARQAGGKGLCRYDARLNDEVGQDRTLNEFISPGFVMYLQEDSKGNLLFAHNDYPANRNFILYRYNPHLNDEAGRDKSFHKITEQKEPSNNPVIFGMIEDKSGNIWFGTAKGICRYDGKTFDYF